MARLAIRKSPAREIARGFCLFPRYDPGMGKAFRPWLLALTGCALFCLVSVLFIDRPVAAFFDTPPHARHVIGMWLRAVPFVIALGVLAIFWSRIRRHFGRPPSKGLMALSRAGVAAALAWAVNDLLLKPAFGRFNLDGLASGHYGFVPFGHVMDPSFPSGHTAMTAAFLGVLWQIYPKLRPVHAAALAALAFALMVARWHFLSDIAAGVFVGTATAALMLKLWPVRIAAP